MAVCTASKPPLSKGTPPAAGGNTVEVYRQASATDASIGTTIESIARETLPARAVSAAYTAFDAALRDGYKDINAARSAVASEFIKTLESGGDTGAAGPVARSVSDLRNTLREFTQGQLTPAGKAVSELLEQNREWGAIVEKYGNPFDEALSAEARLAAAERIAQAAAKSSKLANVLQNVGKAMLLLNAAQAGWQVGRGVDEIGRGRVGEGAIDLTEGAANLGLTVGTSAATKAGLLVGEAGSAAGGLTLAAGAAAAGSVTLAAQSARAAVNGEATPVEVADRYYGSQLGDIARWQKESTAARATLGVATAGMSETWLALNKLVEQ